MHMSGDDKLDIRFRFHWRRPTARVYTTAERAPWAILNRYPGCVIGVGLKVGRRRQLSIVWGKPGAPIVASDPS